MPVTNYATMDGVIVGETGPNGNLYYHTDALGSVTTVSDQSGDAVLQLRYKPYGTLQSQVGSAPLPKFTWVGTQGYRQTGRYHSDVYVRARHLGTPEASWTTIDKMWPSQRPFAYASSLPIQLIDPTGRYTCTGCSNSSVSSDTWHWVISPDLGFTTVDVDMTFKNTSQSQMDTSCSFSSKSQSNAVIDLWGVTDNDVGYICIELGVLFSASIITQHPVVGLAAATALAVICSQKTNALGDCREARGKTSGDETLYHYKFASTIVAKTSGNAYTQTNCSRTSQETTSCLGGKILSTSNSSNSYCLPIYCGLQFKK